jgi:hypothetical protein
MHFVRIPAKHDDARKRTKSNCSAREPIVIHPSVSRALVVPYLPLDHQVVYCYSTEKVRTLFKNQLYTVHGLSRGKIECLCTIHVLGVDPRKFLPAGGTLRTGSHYAGGANETSLKGKRNTPGSDRRRKS